MRATGVSISGLTAVDRGFDPETFGTLGHRIAYAVTQRIEQDLVYG